MSPLHKATTVAERYDQARHYARDDRLPPDAPHPQPTSAWPAENVRLLERYHAWLLSSGTSPSTVDFIYVPMAGHVLGLHLKPHAQLDLDLDLERALDYVKAKQVSAQWLKMCRNALAKFRLFLSQERGVIPTPNCINSVKRYQQGLPAWLCRELERYQQVMQSHWRLARVNEQTRRFWLGHVRLWRWLLDHYTITAIQNLKRQHLMDYVDHQLRAGYAVSTINGDLRNFHAFLLFLQDNDQAIPQALLRVPSLKQPDRLPKFLTDEQVRQLRDDFEQRIMQAHYPTQKRDALLDRAAFYLLWQGGLRLGEVEDLQLEDLDLENRKLTVRQGKGMKDRTVFLTETAVQAMKKYLAVRGLGPSSHVFLYRNQPVHKDLIRSRLKLAGARVGVKVHPHRLRHTCATQLLNAGCRVTSIQKFLGHKRLNSTMIYARAHDKTVADDYYRAMTEIENRLAVADAVPVSDPDVNDLLALVEELQKSTLNERQIQVVQTLHTRIVSLPWHTTNLMPVQLGSSIPSPAIANQ
ncbi:MAG: tyrosine-type recombinase/integrase [Chloroflexi bacterium]|nr:tyrosine-type recombinase/integrase [Chloroflexota bacterium]